MLIFNYSYGNLTSDGGLVVAYTQFSESNSPLSFQTESFVRKYAADGTPVTNTQALGAGTTVTGLDALLTGVLWYWYSFGFYPWLDEDFQFLCQWSTN